jgi:hypothetical protein
MDLPSEEVFILLELPELTPPSESPSMSDSCPDSLSVSVKCLFLFMTARREFALLLLLGLELLQDKSVGSRGGDGEEVDTDMGRGDGSKNLG